MAELSRNILVQPLCGHAIVRSSMSHGGFFIFNLWPGLKQSGVLLPVITTIKTVQKAAGGLNKASKLIKTVQDV